MTKEEIKLLIADLDELQVIVNKWALTCIVKKTTEIIDRIKTKLFFEMEKDIENEINCKEVQNEKKFSNKRTI